MIMADIRPRPLIERLPQVRGRLTAQAPLAGITWFRVGGPAEVMFRPADLEDLQHFLSGLPADVPVTVIGVGSNLLVRDGGVPGVVLRLGRSFAEIRIGPGHIRAGAAALDLSVARMAAEAGIAGLEFLSGIPGTMGGALRMNAGAYGHELVDVVTTAEAVDRQGKLHRLTKGDLGLTYRHSSVPEDWIFTGAELAGGLGATDAILARLAEIQAARETTQPLRRQHLRQSSGTEGLGADRSGRLPRPHPRRRHGLGEALQLPDQHRPGDCGRDRVPGRDPA